MKFRASTLLKGIGFIAIPGLLMVLLFPAVNGGPNNPRFYSAKNDAVQISTAVMAFETEYGRLPGTNEGVVGGTLLAALVGSNSLLNPRNIVFIEVPAAKKRKGGISNGIFVDPWGGSYLIAFDSDTNNTVTAGTNHVEINKKVAVWNDPNMGTDAAGLSEGKKKRRYVTSWE